MKEHKLFKPRSVEEAKNAVVGDCNGFTMQERWNAETPLFAEEICKYAPKDSLILDYGCGLGRLSKGVLDNRSDVRVIGVDASDEMLATAKTYVDSERFEALRPYEIVEKKFDLTYCVYVLQHAPAIELREIIQRVHYTLKDDGYFVYCSSDYRMAVRFDDPAFFDDRFLGVDLQSEIERYFERVEDLFSQELLDKNKILNQMIAGDLKHPAIVYKKKVAKEPLFNFGYEVSQKPKTFIKSFGKQSKLKSNKKSVVLINRLAPGDILVMTNAIRELKRNYPEYTIAVKTPCNDIFDNNPYIQNISFESSKYDAIHKQFIKTADSKNLDDRKAFIDDLMFIDMQYPSIDGSGMSGDHFGSGHLKFLEKILDIPIKQESILPDIFLSDAEKKWASQVFSKFDFDGPYWVINAGTKEDYTLKQYHQYQEVVDLLKDRITFVQIGHKSHNHKPLNGVLDLTGETNVRQLFRLIYHAHGVLTCVSFPMHIAAAFRKPCVVVAGAREGTRWELYPNHQFLYVNGCLPCAQYDGCWKSQHKDCLNLQEDGIPLCMKLIRPEDVVRSIERYYEGGVLKYGTTHRQLARILQ